MHSDLPMSGPVIGKDYTFPHLSTSLVGRWGRYLTDMCRIFQVRPWTHGSGKTDEYTALPLGNRFPLAHHNRPKGRSREEAKRDQKIALLTNDSTYSPAFTHLSLVT